ncbi:MAG: DUF2270 domain-containing protein [Chloroflexota bacterium]
MADTQTNPSPPAADSAENVWTFRGYRLRPGEFNTALVHFYRGEITRSNVWRMRLDSTTNWAVVTTGAVLTFAFGSINNSHVVILLSFLLVGLFLVIEARRYRYYELWALRVRLMETDFFAAMLTPPFAPHQEWAARLAESLLTPGFPITYLEAVGRRLRRNYVWLFLILGAAWSVKLLLHPSPAYSWRSFLSHATIGFVAGDVVMLIVVIFLAVLVFLAVFTTGLQDSPGEVLSHHEVLNLSTELLHTLANAASHMLPEEMALLRHREQLVIIITDKPRQVSDQLLSYLKRGVTALEGKGMYTGQSRSVLLCVIDPSQTPHLKSLVYTADEHAFVLVNPTEEVLGSTFGKLQPRWRQALEKAKRGK